MTNCSKLSNDENSYLLAGIITLTDGVRYAVIAHEGHMYAVSYNRYLREGAGAMCEVKDWLCSLVKVVKRSDKNGIKSVLISWYDERLKKEVIEEFVLSKHWRREMMTKGIGVTASYHKRRILLAWFKCDSVEATVND